MDTTMGLLRKRTHDPRHDDRLYVGRTGDAADLQIVSASGSRLVDVKGRSFIELHVAPIGLVFDTYLPEDRKYEDDIVPKRKQFDWNSKTKAGV